MLKESKNTISIIVPMYNVEKYLERCLKSIQKQSFSDFEVLLIDDGSSDNSAAIAQKFCDTDDRFHIIHKENSGVSDCRNIGLRKATGEYITFIDSDDYLSPDYLYVLYNTCIQYDADMSYCRFKYSYFNTGISFPNFPSHKATVLDTDTAVDLLIRDMVLHSYPWNKLYRKSLFTENGIEYPCMFFEDLATSTLLLIHSNKLAITDKYLYYYVKHFNSIVSTMNCEKINDYWRSILIIRNYIQRQGLYERHKDALQFLAKKAYTINIYSIIRQHIIHFSFKNMRHNLQINKKLFEYIVSESYKIKDSHPELPFLLVQPQRNKKKKS